VVLKIIDRQLNAGTYRVGPPCQPKYNGGVERGNRTFKEEFYYRNDLLADSIGAIRYELKKALEKYNTYRPHKNLAQLTPMAYIQNTQSEAKTESQIM